MSALRSAHLSLTAFTREHGLTAEAVEEVQESWQDALQQQREVDEALAGELPITVDDAEVEEEYEQMLRAEAEPKKQQSTPPQPHVVVAPAGAAKVVTKAVVDITAL